MAAKKIPDTSGASNAVAPAIQEQQALQLVMELMAVEGPSCEEGAIADEVRERLLRAGAKESAISHDTAHRRTPLPGQVGNLIFKLPGVGRLRSAPRRMLSAHLDTVPVCIGSQPKRTTPSGKDSPRGDVVVSAAKTGLGADNRAGCATILTTALALLESPDTPHPPLTFCWFVQEEIGLQGARALTVSKLSKPQLAFNWDGGSPAKLTIGATGGIRMEIEVTGIASHAGGAPERGVSALAIVSLAIADIHQAGWHGDIHHDGKHGTSNIGVVQGGVATNVVADFAKVRAECRSHDRAFRNRIEKEIRQAFQRAVKKVTNVGGQRGKVAIESRLDYDSFLLKSKEPCVLEAERAVRAVGLAPERAIANGGLDANWTTKHGIPTVSLGCGQRNQHMVTEQLIIPEYLDACRIAMCLATSTEG